MATVKHGKRYYKQMAFEVAVRTPERYIDILKTFGKFEGRILNDSCILDMYIQLYLDGVIDANDLEVVSYCQATGLPKIKRIITNGAFPQAIKLRLPDILKLYQSSVLFILNMMRFLKSLPLDEL